MVLIPGISDSEYRVASDAEVRRWSFGAVRRPRPTGRASWEGMSGTLDDQAIFGPKNEFECACGKLRGAELERRICDICGVRIGPASDRWRRFGHVELVVPLKHPMGSWNQLVRAFPILPAAYFEVKADGDLLEAYDDLIRVNRTPAGSELAGNLDQVVSLILLLAQAAVASNPPEVDVLVKGLGLVGE
jgi:hypothetical protein